MTGYITGNLDAKIHARGVQTRRVSIWSYPMNHFLKQGGYFSTPP